MLPAVLLGCSEPGSVLAVAVWVAPFPAGLVTLVCTIVMVFAVRGAAPG
ncbi:hypothetical protein [Actinoplanes sp. NPDC049802]